MVKNPKLRPDKHVKYTITKNEERGLPLDKLNEND
jgi:hypothetical protein